MNRIQHALIMAAGRGQRMMPLTSVVPKPMAPVQGSTLIARKIGEVVPYVPKIHVTIGYKGAMLAQHVIESGASSVHNTGGQSNSWWIHNTLLTKVNEPMYVLTCDNVAVLDFSLLEKSYYDLGEPACMLVGVTPVPGLEGDYIFSKDYRVSRVDRHTPSEIYCSGIQILNPARVAELTTPGGSFYQIWNQLIEKQELYVSSVHPENWIAIDTLEQLEKYSHQVGQLPETQSTS